MFLKLNPGQVVVSSYDIFSPFQTCVNCHILLFSYKFSNFNYFVLSLFNFQITDFDNLN